MMLQTNFDEGFPGQNDRPEVLTDVRRLDAIFSRYGVWGVWCWQLREARDLDVMLYLQSRYLIYPWLSHMSVFFFFETKLICFFRTYLNFINMCS